METPMIKEDCIVAMGRNLAQTLKFASDDLRPREVK